jgi:hypothetical protein
MTKRERRRSRPPTGMRKPYVSPELAVYGDIAKLTKVKKGTKNDGAGKPKTKASGGNA